MTLNELPVGKAAVITKVGGAGALRCRLLDMGLIPKTKIVITKVAFSADIRANESKTICRKR